MALARLLASRRRAPDATYTEGPLFLGESHLHFDGKPYAGPDDLPRLIAAHCPDQ
jgi:hypothetical protein